MNPTDNEKRELLPCPFCGGARLQELAVSNTNGNRRYVWCLACNAKGPWSLIEQSASEQWNRRAVDLRRELELEAKPKTILDLLDTYEKALEQLHSAQGTEQVGWQGCNECDNAFPCYMGAAPCIRLFAASHDGWREAVIDALIICHIYSAAHENDPRKALSDLIAYETQIALDPRVSGEAQALIEQGKALALHPKAEGTKK